MDVIGEFITQNTVDKYLPIRCTNKNGIDESKRVAWRPVKHENPEKVTSTHNIT